MGSSPNSEIMQADCKPQQSYSMLLKSFGDHHNNNNQPAAADQNQKQLQEFLAHLEEEWLKIEAFKRELPLCMQLLANAMEASRQQLQGYKLQENNQEQKPVLEEFIPLKHSNSEGPEKTSNMSEKSSWMVSAQLWSQNNTDGMTTKLQQTTMNSMSNNVETEQSYGGSPKLGLDEKKRSGSGTGAGAFLPFSKERNTCSSPTLRALPELALAPSEKDNDEKKGLEQDNRISCIRRDQSSGKVDGSGATGSQMETQGTNGNTSQTHRKARRCWSPDLHRRFVNALQMLGGSQVATPKQIRELMKVDGLTNDEVKSHLQKYRLHTRRPSPSPQTGGPQTPQLVVLGSIWVPPEYAAAAAAGGSATIYGAHPASLTTTHYCAPQVPQDFYPAPPPQFHHQGHHHVYKISSQAHNSPESDMRGSGGDRSESIEDGKSDSSSWKGDSGENGEGERRGLASLRDEQGDNSNGNEITLKF